jgi:hypothetical protein
MCSQVRFFRLSNRTTRALETSVRGPFSIACTLALAVLAAVLCSAGRAAAEADDRGPAERADSGAALSAGAGMFLPTTIAARTDSQTGYVRALGGYDSARRSAQFEALADVTIIGPLAARVGVLYSERPNSFRPSLGLRVQALSQEKMGLDMGIGAFYRPEGFTEAEGEIELVLAFGRTFGRLGTFANIVYGQDPEGAERDGEVRLGALYAVTELLQAGLDARLRLDLGSEGGDRRTEGGAEYDVIVGPTASYALGPIAAIAQAGFSVFGTQQAKLGAVALLGVAGVLR